MNRSHWKELLPVIIAFANGEQIELKMINGNNWEDINDAEFGQSAKNYRIKPTPKYRPFTYEEAVERLLGKGIKDNDGNVGIVHSVDKEGAFHFYRSRTSFSNYYEFYTFLDGSPCGMLVE